MTTEPTNDLSGAELADAFVAANEEAENVGKRLGAFFGIEPVERLVDLRTLTWGTVDGYVFALGEGRLVRVLDADHSRNFTLHAFVGRGELAGFWSIASSAATLHLFTTAKRDDGEVRHAMRRFREGTR